MKKRLYIIPLTEVAKVNMSGVILTSPTDDTPAPPIHPGAPKFRAPALGNDSVPVF